MAKMTRREKFDTKYKPKGYHDRVASHKKNHEDYKFEERLSKFNKKESARSSRSTGGIFVVIIISLLVIALFKSLVDGGTISFTSFLTALSSNKTVINVVDIMQGVNLVIVEEWAILDGLRIFINSVLSIVEVLIYIVLCFASLIEFCFWILTYLFIT